MLVVVPGEELLAEGAAVLNAAEAIRKAGPVLQGAKLAFRVRVVVRNVGSAVRLGDAQVGHQERHWFGAHDFSTVGVNGQLARRYGVFLQGVLNEVFGQFGRFPLGDHPAGNITAEDVDHYVELEVVPFDRPPQFGDVPAPQLIGCGGQQLRFLIGRMNGLVAALARFSFLFQKSIHRPGRAKIVPFIQQGGLDGRRSPILKAFFMQNSEHTLAFLRPQSPRG